MAKKIVLGSDHGGYALKEVLRKALEDKGYAVHDAGAHTSDPCDYPLIGFECANMVSLKKAFRAVLICRTGIGMAIAANKIAGVRAGVCREPKEAISSREHNDTNVLVLPADFISSKEALAILRAWLDTRALKGRHARRVKQIKDHEKLIYKKSALGK